MLFNQRTEYVVSYAVEQRETIKVTDMVRNSAPNKLQKDGRIYFRDEDGNPIAITVSPLHEKFETQIEPGVWSLVKSLVDKGYLTVSSCEGHDGSDFFVKIVFDGRASADEFVKALPTIPGLQIKIEDQSANVVRYLEHGQVKYRKVLPDENVSKHEEVKFINMLFYRNYVDCCYVSLYIYPTLKTYNVFKQFQYYREKRKNFKTSKNALVTFIKTSLPDYIL